MVAYKSFLFALKMAGHMGFNGLAMTYGQLDHVSVVSHDLQRLTK